MGAGESKEDVVTAGVLEVRRAVLSGATDVARLSSLTWDQFLNYISQLNIKCRELPDASGKYVIFAIKKGTHENWAWKATVRICAVKMNSGTGKVESRKIMTLREFLRLHTTLEDLIVPTAEASTSNQPLPMDASLIMQKIPVGEEKGSTEGKEVCCICMERKPEAILPCTHGFCLPCIEQWNTGRKWCPICRAELESTGDAWIISEAANSAELSEYLLNTTNQPNPLHQPPNFPH